MENLMDSESIANEISQSADRAAIETPEFCMLRNVSRIEELRPIAIRAVVNALSQHRDKRFRLAAVIINAAFTEQRLVFWMSRRILEGLIAKYIEIAPSDRPELPRTIDAKTYAGALAVLYHEGWIKNLKAHSRKHMKPAVVKIIHPKLSQLFCAEYGEDSAKRQEDFVLKRRNKRRKTNKKTPKTGMSRSHDNGDKSDKGDSSICDKGDSCTVPNQTAQQVSEESEKLKTNLEIAIQRFTDYLYEGYKQSDQNWDKFLFELHWLITSHADLSRFYDAARTLIEAHFDEKCLALRNKCLFYLNRNHRKRQLALTTPKPEQPCDIEELKSLKWLWTREIQIPRSDHTEILLFAIHGPFYFRVIQKGAGYIYTGEYCGRSYSELMDWIEKFKTAEEKRIVTQNQIIAAAIDQVDRQANREEQ